MRFARFRFRATRRSVGRAGCVLACLYYVSFLSGAESGPQPAINLTGFSALAPIDVHAHVFKNGTGFRRDAEAPNLRILDVCVVDKHDRGYEKCFRTGWPERLCIAPGAVPPGARLSNPQDFEKPGFASRSIKVLNDTFAQEAVAVKIYKNIGMELKKHDGSYLMPDDPVFNPIFADISAHGRTVLAHIAEPTSSWRPLDPANPDYSYYKDNPDWFMYLHPDHPSKETILAARHRACWRTIPSCALSVVIWAAWKLTSTISPSVWIAIPTSPWIQRRASST